MRGGLTSDRSRAPAADYDGTLASERPATFLAGADPSWTRHALLHVLNNHLALTTREAVDRLQHNWADNQTTFDNVYSQAMEMADALSDGIIKQFPPKV